MMKQVLHTDGAEGLLPLGDLWLPCKDLGRCCRVGLECRACGEEKTAWSQLRFEICEYIG